ncbi:MAG: hypothetical protein IPJ19_08455 [Planctomycetes bacterium]|nr:hypothetical protein [Planctomycetota bacterium]
MKNLILGAALIAFSFGCKSNSNSAVSDPADANMPKAECTKGACEGMKGQCEGMKQCEGQKSSCCDQKKPQG